MIRGLLFFNKRKIEITSCLLKFNSFCILVSNKDI